MNITYQPELPKRTHPIVIIGAGSIVRDARLPAYRQAGFKVHGFRNRSLESAWALAQEYGISHLYKSYNEALEQTSEDTIWDLTLPASLLQKTRK